ncbi:zinc finger protein 512 isoform X5 [Hippopotamus amphibius kiboko]|uniref:zinc finger protein 512 isoform X5 n=1 Tax=Hippopotamus amphibius kiboko TaxID=575201 RepID=UPI002596F882|nr:zinc finger protein 512 isoform X5 [Hippopotamus amphibius kiboko]
MSSRLGAVPATPGPTSFKQQRSTRIVGAKNSRTQCSIKDNSFQYTIPHDDSLSGSSSASSCEPVSDFPASFRKSTYWMKMRRIKPAATSHVEGSGGGSAKGKRKPRQEEDEDYREFPQKKHKLYGRKQRPKTQPNPKAQARRFRKEPPAYAAGSLEEQWYLEIVDKGSVSCPTCQAVGRKTIEGLKKHMENCKQEMFTCHHCGKQLRSLAGMKYHVMANHNSLPILKAGDEIDEPSERERLRTVLKRLGKLRCMRESCSSSFTSIMGYLYHVRKCGKGAAELEKMTLKCHHCGKPYRSKAGLAYHLRSEHGPISFFPESGQPECLKDMSLEPKSGGRVQRRSAKIAVYHLQELASAELAKEWPKRKVLQDLVPDDRKDWFVVNPTTTKSFEKLMKIKQRQQEEEKRRQQHRSRRSLRRRQQPGIELPETELSLRVGKDQRRNHEELLVSTSCKEPEQEPVPTQFQKVKPPKTNHKRGKK